MQALKEDQDKVRFDGERGPITLRAKRPKGWGSDISWWSADDLERFGFFQSLFETVAAARMVAPYVDFENAVRLYAGFFVVRRECVAENFHVDWQEANNDGFTMMIPLTDNSGELGLSYLDFWNQARRYDYRVGKALIFGDYFRHSTAQGRSREAAVFLCFTFGTDKMAGWKQLRLTAARQGNMYCRPDGVFVRGGKEVS